MLSKKLFRLAHIIALFAIVFASLAPSISHALQGNSGAAFAQEICTTDGKKITIQVITTKGQQLATEFTAQTSNNKAPTGIQHHLQHCPFCANSSTDAALEAHTPIIATLTAQAQQVSAITQTVLPRFSALPPPAQAPPTLL